MAKKSTSAPKAAAPAVTPAPPSTPRVTASKRAAKAPAKPKAPASGGNGVKVTAKAPSPKSPKAASAKPAKAAAISAKPKMVRHEDIALRAYFISEKRRNAGIAGDSHQDWLEAERQIFAETRKKRKSPKTKV